MYNPPWSVAAGSIIVLDEEDYPNATKPEVPSIPHTSPLNKETAATPVTTNSKVISCQSLPVDVKGSTLPVVPTNVSQHVLPSTTYGIVNELIKADKEQPPANARTSRNPEPSSSLGTHVIDLTIESTPVIEAYQPLNEAIGTSIQSGAKQNGNSSFSPRVTNACDNFPAQTSIVAVDSCSPSIVHIVNTDFDEKCSGSKQQTKTNLPLGMGNPVAHSNRNPCPSLASALPTKNDRSVSNSSASTPGDFTIIDLDANNEVSLDSQMEMSSPGPAPQMVVDLDEDESNVEDDKEEVITQEELDTWLRSQHRGRARNTRYGQLQASSVNSAPRAPTRNLPVAHPYQKLTTYTHNGMNLRPGISVELRDKTYAGELEPARISNEPHNNFLKIVDIIQDTEKKIVTLRGWLFTRTQYLNGILEKKKNELCWVLHVDEDDPRDMKIQGMETVSVDDVVKRRKIRLTNQPWPKLSYRDDEDGLEDSDHTIRNQRVLACRFMYVCFYVSEERRNANSWSERVLQRLRAEDCDEWPGPNGEPCALADTELRKQWRGNTELGGAFFSHSKPDSEGQEQIDLTEDDPIDLIRQEAIPTTAMPETSSSGVILENQSPRITNIATRIDWVASDGTEYYTINGFVPAKRSAEASESSRPSKRPCAGLVAAKDQDSQTDTTLEGGRRNSSRTEFPVSRASSKQRRKPVHNLNAVGNCSPSTVRQYLFGDSFCGAGGMSRAAYQSGLHIKYAFDCNKHACNSYELNFPITDLHCLWAHEFVGTDVDCKVDIAHLSPPCQFFSDAHTVMGKDDEMNTASLFAVGELLKKSKPRVVTLEQTFGIVLRAKHQGYLNALIQVFTSNGFSIRWRLLHCADYGLPQMRLRTFMIASCPGEPLPPFPKPTHSSSPATTGLRPWTTINAALDSIPPSASNHDLDRCKPRSLAPRDGDCIAKTVTCNGNGQIHPSGQRDLTIREFAALQGFPTEHVFGSVGAKKQVGNAVPPVVGRKVLESVVRALQKADGVRNDAQR
ncbi:MAG: hypothetical protein Q9212_004691 [Teloschistes hypoglaucus]